MFIDRSQKIEMRTFRKRKSLEYFTSIHTSSDSESWNDDSERNESSTLCLFRWTWPWITGLDSKISCNRWIISTSFWNGDAAWWVVRRVRHKNERNAFLFYFFCLFFKDVFFLFTHVKNERNTLFVALCVYIVYVCVCVACSVSIYISGFIYFYIIFF